MQTADDEYPLRIYTQEEIELFLAGERRDVDRLLLYGINDLVRVIIPHKAREDKFFEAAGTRDEIRQRAAWVDAQIDKQKKRNEMMGKVATSALSWAAIAFLGWMLVSLYSAAVEAVQSAIAASAAKKP